MDLTLLKMKNKKSSAYVDVSDFLAEGSKVSQYDVSTNSGRDVTNANGDMIYNVVNEKWRLDILTKPLTADEMVEFFAEIVKSPFIYMQFNDPFRGGTATAYFYRGDRAAEYKWAVSTSNVIIEGAVYKQVSIAIIEI